ncbi:hypothetical protein NE865_00683 [Phthorimaea operculella]|nr:hypothetical protein NE865_00683 [Phthorimaea operculella]
MASLCGGEVNQVNFGFGFLIEANVVAVFAGDYADWPAFEDLYSSVVHTRTDITPAYKMAQLMSRLHGEPRELLTHLAVSDSNYEVAWKILTDRYRNKRLIVDRLLDQWLSIPTITRGEWTPRLVKPSQGDLCPRHPERPGAPARGGNSGNPGGTTPHWNQGVPTAGRQATGWQRVRSLLRSGFRGDGVWHSRGVGVFGAWGRIRCECPSSTNCRYCQGAHHPLLCMNRSGGAGAALDRISEGACPPREGATLPTLQGGAHLRIGHRDRQGDVNRRSPLTQGRGDDPHHGSRCRIGEERHRNVAKDTHPRTRTSLRVHTLEVFVANRVSQITGSETPLVWRHVPGEWNPADCASRGCRAPDLVSHPLWWGPQWLTESPQEWPFNECRAPLGPPDRGLRVNVGQLVPKPNPAFLLERYSSLDKLLGVTGWIKRFVNNCRKPQAERNFTPVLSPAERNAALCSLVRVVQAEHFEEEGRQSVNSLKNTVVIATSDKYLRAALAIVVYRYSDRLSGCRLKLQ